MKKKIDGLKELINNLKKTDRGRALLFFLGYLVFFVILFIIIGTSGRIVVDRDDFESGIQAYFNVDNIKDNNYSYKYNITVDVNDYVFTGKRDKDNEMFKYMDVNYFRDYEEKVIYKEEDGKWNKSNNPNDFDYFTNIDNIVDLVNAATYISKTEYESGKKTYNYEISTTTIEKIKNENYIDLDDKPNEIVFSTDEDENVNKIILNLNSYGKYNNICKKYLTIELEYDNFGEIKEIKNPISE